MSCNCGCHDDKPPATGWRKFVPLIVGAIVVGALVVGAVLQKDAPAKKPSMAPVGQTASVPKPGR